MCLCSALIQAWLSEIYEYASSDVIIMLLGNKVCILQYNQHFT